MYSASRETKKLVELLEVGLKLTAAGVTLFGADVNLMLSAILFLFC